MKKNYFSSLINTDNQQGNNNKIIEQNKLLTGEAQ